MYALHEQISNRLNILHVYDITLRQSPVDR